MEPDQHSPYSDPGEFAHLLRQVPPQIELLSAVARNLIVHYRTGEHDLPEATRDDVNLRWMAAMLATDAQRNPAPLDEPRAPSARLQGCCRDHTLFSVAVLREHGVAARSLVGFADYFTPGFHHDHLIVEAWLDGRWVRFDSELGPDWAFDPTDMPVGADTPFRSAAHAWLSYRAGALDPDRFGVGPDLPFRGPGFLRGEVIHQVAHRHGDELLLWDSWGAMGRGADDDVDLIDHVADLLVRTADAAPSSSDAATLELADLYRQDERLHPGEEIETFTPLDSGPPTRTHLRRPL